MNENPETRPNETVPNESLPNEGLLAWPDLPITALRSRVSSMAEGYSLRVGPWECARLCFLRDALAGLVDVQFTGEPNDQILLAVGRVIHAHLRDQRPGRRGA